MRLMAIQLLELGVWVKTYVSGTREAEVPRLSPANSICFPLLSTKLGRTRIPGSKMKCTLNVHTLERNKNLGINQAYARAQNANFSK